MLWNPPRSFDELIPPLSVHVVPPTVWYALSLLHRRADGDVERAVRAIDALIDCQYDEPGAPWHGTFARFREWAAPSAGAIEYVGYDPNWRQFVGTGFALALQLAGDVLPASCQAAMVSSIALALDGEPADRVSPAYSNIAIMRAWLEVSGGAPIGRDDLVRRGVALGEAIASRFDEVGGLDEWNSPTYYGVDLYALALWRSSGLLSGLGARLEAALWRDLAPWYHPGLGNMCGPYTRAYGMDMHSYAAVLGFWIPGGRAVPDLETAFSHTHDLSMLPIAGLLGSSIPSDVDLVSFVGERRLERTITPSRVASGWLGPDVMIGGERGDRQMMCAGQYHAATVHWREGWVRVHHRGVVDATASPGGLSVVSRGSGRTSFVIGGGAVSVSASCWQLPGATVRVATNAGFGGFDRGRVRYDPPSGGGVATFELEVTTG